jgi:hypothetical protein
LVLLAGQGIHDVGCLSGVTRQTLHLLGLATALACSDSTAPIDGVHVRVANESSFAFEAVDVVFPEDSVDYGAVPSRGVSEYREVNTAYRYALIIVRIAGDEMRLQPIDYVGETPLREGRYTYALNLSAQGHLTLEFRSD